MRQQLHPCKIDFLTSLCYNGNMWRKPSILREVPISDEFCISFYLFSQVGKMRCKIALKKYGGRKSPERGTVMKVKEIKEVILSWRRVVDKRFMEISANPELIGETLHFEYPVESPDGDFVQNILDDPSCWYTDSYQIEEFTLDDTYSKCIESSPIEDSLVYENGQLSLNVTFRYAFYQYDKFNCCFSEISEEDYEQWKYDNDLPNNF